MRQFLSSLSLAVFVLAVVALGITTDGTATAICAVSFWHYLIYALAFSCRAVPLEVFRRDAVMMKGVALLALGFVYLPDLSSPLSLLVVVAGFALNAAAARALGSERTYYGQEIAGLPHLRIRTFPYSITAHPMLLGNAVAFAGPLLDPVFRRDWWPLAAAHVAFNLAIMVMEVRPPLRPSHLAAGFALAVAAFTVAFAGEGSAVIGVAIAAAVLGGTLFHLYARPLRGDRR